MSGLIERIEAAGGPDRQLDMLVENALGLAIFDRDPAVGFGDADYNRRDPKPYTASIDAAVTLVPEGWEWAYFDKRAIVRIPDTLKHEMGEAATPALSIICAALRARETTPSIKGGDRG